MFFNKKKEGQSVVKSILAAYFILILHVILVAGIWMVVLFCKGVVLYAFWIFIFGSAAIIFSGYLLYKRAKKEGRAVREILGLPAFDGRNVEVSFMGGLASIKVGKPEGNAALPGANQVSGRTLQLENLEDVNVSELAQLVRLLENDLITKEEYEKAKKIIFKDNKLN